jgi:hypothetical protein
MAVWIPILVSRDAAAVKWRKILEKMPNLHTTIILENIAEKILCAAFGLSLGPGVEVERRQKKKTGRAQ